MPSTTRTVCSSIKTYDEAKRNFTATVFHRELIVTAAPDQSTGPRILETQPVSPVQLAHVVLRTPRYAEMRRFYTMLLNAVPAFENDLASFLRYDEEHHRLLLVNAPRSTAPAEDVAGLAHFAFTYSTLNQLLGTYSRLKMHGIPPCWCINHGFTTSIYYYDPDGNQIETQYDNMSVTEADAYMRSDYFAINPIGVDFNPDLLIERFLRGDPLSELIKQRSAPFAPDAIPVRPRRVLDYDFRGLQLSY
jgi:catechol 2,3-dioxygenase-like lactoylglutathione lyase family enzyme